MNFSIAAMVFILGLSQVHSHGTEVRRCLTPAGDLRIFVEHWHVTATAPWYAPITTTNAGTMTIKQNHLSGTPSITILPTGVVYNTLPGSLPGCISSDTLVATCNQVHNNWVYYDFPTTCNNPVSYSLVSGNTVVLEEACLDLYPAQITGTFSDTTAPSIKIDGNDCAGYTINADKCSGVATWATTVVDDCDPNPTIVSTTYVSGNSFPIGNTPVTVVATDNTGLIATCTFTVSRNRCPTSPPTQKPTRSPTRRPTSRPTSRPTPAPTREPTNAPTSKPTRRPTSRPTPAPTNAPTDTPTDAPTDVPTNVPSKEPSNMPSREPSNKPSNMPSSEPSKKPSSSPSIEPSNRPSTNPSVTPSNVPSFAPSNWHHDHVDLGSACNFAILTKSGVTTTGTTSVIGNMGTSPITLAAITGFGMTLAGDHSTSSMVTGNIYSPDHAVPTPGMMTTAIYDMEAAYVDAAGRVGPGLQVELGAGNLTGMTLGPGIYKWSTTVGFSTTLTFNGTSTDVWIMQIAGTFTVGPGASIMLAGDAKAENIYWAIADVVAFDDNSHGEGIFLAQTMISFNAGSSLHGAALAQTEVTMIATDISGACIMPTPPPNMSSEDSEDWGDNSTIIEI